MKLYVNLLIILLFFNLLCVFPQPCDFIAYHERIYKAEEHISLMRFSEALSIYNELIDLYPHMFYKDLHNACICAIKTGNMDRAFQLAEQLVLQGYELYDFNYAGFRPLQIETSHWNQFLNNYPEIRKQYHNKLDTALRSQYYRLFIKDQEAATSYNLKTQDSMFYHQSMKLSNLFIKNGFPTLNVNKDTLDLKIFVQLRHYFGLVNRFNKDEDMQNDPFYINMDFKNSKLDVLLWDALCKGKLLPQTYADAVSYFDDKRYGDLAIDLNFEKETVSLYLHLSEQELELVNKRRLKIGLFPVSSNSDIFLETTWYKHYPFKEIKEAWMNCDTCESGLQYLNIQGEIENIVKEKFNNVEENDFILFDFHKIKSIWMSETMQYQPKYLRP